MASTFEEGGLPAHGSPSFLVQGVGLCGFWSRARGARALGIATRLAVRFAWLVCIPRKCPRTVEEEMCELFARDLVCEALGLVGGMEFVSTGSGCLELLAFNLISKSEGLTL